MIISKLTFDQKKANNHSFEDEIYPKNHILAGLPLFTAPVVNIVKNDEKKTVQMNSINDIMLNCKNDIINERRHLVFAGKITKKAGEHIPFSLNHLIETEQAGLTL